MCLGEQSPHVLTCECALLLVRVLYSYSTATTEQLSLFGFHASYLAHIPINMYIVHDTSH